MYRRNSFIIYAMTVTPVVFLTLSIVDLFRLSSAVPASLVRNQVDLTLLFMLIIPVVVPAAIAAYSVIGERDQGTLEPLLTTPITREELLLGKALAAIIPSVGTAYLLFAIIVVSVHVGASRAVAGAIWQPRWFLAQLLFAPLLAGWSIWVGTAISARSSDVRVATQLSSLASLPTLALTSLMTFQVLEPTVTLALELGLALALINIAAWRVVSRMFDRERLVTGTRARRDSSTRI